ncbi:hypothetical protein KBD20_04770 [Candidatus Saccharibacteria bacterium]|nr:hypothetical protein [Candidatus Saccharibacteria bacterium]
MYSGTTLHSRSGNLVGAHQKFDRVARRFIKTLRNDAFFPTITHILHFEGNNGPDAIKRKSPGTDEPWHFWNPTNKDDTRLLKTIDEHYAALVSSLKAKEEERAAFEAAWLAHAIVDGLTPAHHYEYEEKLTELRGEGIETRTSLRHKVVIPADTRREAMSKNWQMWGAKGLIISHVTFEFGVASVAKPHMFKNAIPREGDIKHAKNVGLDEYLRENALIIHNLNMYERFLARGWNATLAHDIRRVLCPKTIESVAVAWALAIDEAQDV